MARLAALSIDKATQRAVLHAVAEEGIAAAEVLVKPFSPEDLEAAVADSLGDERYRAA